jgi:hypothetical protein
MQPRIDERMKIEELSPSTLADQGGQLSEPPARRSLLNRVQRLVAFPLMGLVVLVLVAAGAAGLWGIIGKLNQDRAYSTDAELTRARLQDMLTIDLPEGFEPECSVDLRTPLRGKPLSQWSMYQWHDSDSFVLVAHAGRDLTKFQQGGQQERNADAVDMGRIVQELLFDRGRIFEPLFFGPPDKLDDVLPDGKLGPPRNRTAPVSEKDLDAYLHKQRAGVEQVETIELLGKKVKVWYADGIGLVNDEPYWQVVTAIPTDPGSLLLYAQVKKSELSREQLQAMVGSIRKPQQPSTETQPTAETEQSAEPQQPTETQPAAPQPAVEPEQPAPPAAKQ